MSKFDGLVWKKNDDGWKDIPAGIGYSGSTFNVETTDAVVRVEDAVVPYEGTPVDFKNVNDLLIACPAADDIGVGSPPYVLWAGVHPTNLKAALLVWSWPIIILDPAKISGGTNPSLDGRVMSIELPTNVKIDGTDSATITIQAGAVGSYGVRTDPNEAAVTDTSSGLYAGTKNDTAIGTDQDSQTNGNDVAFFIPCDAATIIAKVSFKYKVEDAVQPCGQPHKIWGVCYCIWGSTTPLSTFSFGSTLDITPASLAPTNQHTAYAGVIADTSYVDRGAYGTIRVSGVSGPIIKVDTKNGSTLPWQPGALVTFNNYNCDTICGSPNMTLVLGSDEALAYVDEDIIKPKERTLQLFTFLETTYYMTTMSGLSSTSIPGFVNTTFFTTAFSNIWAGTTIYATALALPIGSGVQLPLFGNDIFAVQGYFLETPYNGTDLPTPDIKILLADGVTNVGVVINPTNVLAHFIPSTAQVVMPPIGTTQITPITVSDYTFGLTPAGSKLITSIDGVTLSRESLTVVAPPSGAAVINGEPGSLMVSTVNLVVCLPGGGSTSIDVLVAAAGTYGFITSIPTTTFGAGVDYHYLSYESAVSVVTSIGTTVPITTALAMVTTQSPFNVVTSVTLTDPIVTTAIFATTTAFATTGIYEEGLKPYSLHYPTGEPIVKYSELKDLNAFVGAGDNFPIVLGDTVSLIIPSFDPLLKIPVLQRTGPTTAEVKLLISDTAGTLTLIGGNPIQRLRVPTTSRAGGGVCTSGAVSVTANNYVPYEPVGEIRLLSPIPVNKAKGTAEDCPCFLGNDTDGGPSAPGDNSTTAGPPNPCTLRVRRLQLKKCHE